MIRRALVAGLAVLAACTPFRGTLDRTEREKPTHGISTIVDVQVAKHDLYDRIVFTFDSLPVRSDTLAFEGGVPGYRIYYTPELQNLQCGSGRPIFAGGVPLLVQFQPAQAHDVQDGRPTVTWQDSTFGFPAINRVHLTCDFEADLQFLIGVRGSLGERPTHQYRVFEMDNRLVLDLEHGAQ
ncbi:MAG TPA: hypothetical protein VK531_12365 [Gemmatimonadales bacterium]|nr:hypothetical protein [Gemmatimonadales bacterium]